MFSDKWKNPPAIKKKVYKVWIPSVMALIVSMIIVFLEWWLIKVGLGDGWI